MQTIPVVAYTQSRQRAFLTLGLVLGAESLLFGLLVVSFLFLRAVQPVWDPALPASYRLVVPALNTLLLFVSAGLAGRSLAARRQGRKASFIRLQEATLLLGLGFVAAQAFEFSRSGMPVQAPGFGGVFFALMAFHALHLLAGVALLALNLLRAGSGPLRPSDGTAAEVSTWYWFYVTLVWAGLFLILYVF